MKPTIPDYKFLPVFLLVLVCGFWSAPAQAQTYGNEWIVPSQTYYKISTTKNGIHRLTYDWLTASIPGINGVNPQEIKIYRRGQQQAIYVQGEADGQLDQGDFIEFYGQRNDGKLDVALYKNPQFHVNPYYSMFTDTAAYFITWSASPGNRMAPSSVTSAGLTPEPYHIQRTSPFQTRELNNHAILSTLPWPHSYQRGKKYQGEGELQHSYGDESENFGFRSMTSAQGTSRRFMVDTLLNIPTGADTFGLPKPVLRLVISGNSYNNHLADIKVGKTNNTLRMLAANVPIGEWELVTVEYPVNFKDITPATSSAPANLRFQILPQAGTGTIRLVLATLTYPQTFNLAGKPRTIYPDPTKPLSLYRVTNAPANPVGYDLTDLTAIKRIAGTDVGNNQTDFVFENTHPSGTIPVMYIASADQFYTPDGVRAAAFGNISAADRDYIIIAHEVLMQPAQGSQNPVNDYAQYRASAAGGNYKPVVAGVEQVYDQFHYGEKSSYAIKNYIQYMRANSALQMVFLVGKALQLGYTSGNCNSEIPVRIAGTCYEKDLVPTFGYPGSDLAYVMNFKADDYHVQVPIGRTSAQTPDHVVNYLNKVQAHEALAQNLFWRKNILHLVGGITPAEMQVLLAVMNQYKAIAQGLQLGGNVITINKTSFINPVQEISVAPQVNNGVSLISFFGHSGPTVTDLDIGYVSDPSKGYNNTNKYPAMIMAGCATGNAFTGTNSPESDSFGEDWILTKEKGAVTFLAHSSEGSLGDFDRYMRSFYKSAYEDTTYGGPMGFIHQNTVAKALASTTNPQHSLIALLMQMNLQGDPAVQLYGPRKPDYDVTDKPVTISNPTGGLITAEAAELQLTIPLRNLGKALPVTDSISVSVRRILPNTTTIDSTFKIPNFYYTDTAYFRFPGGGPDAYGLNTFEIWVDNVQVFDELEENNNKITLEHFISLSGVAALFPYNYSIVPTQQVTLKGQAFNVLAVNQKYIFEIDTTHTFTSNWKKQSPQITADLLATWSVDLLPSTPANDSVVYFWRVRFDIPGEAPLWSNSSFTYIPGSPTGWAQSHIGQFNADTKDGVSQDSLTRKWEFETFDATIRLSAAGGSLNFSIPTHGLYVNNQEHFGNLPGSGYSDCITHNVAAVLMVVLHPRTLREVTNLAPDPAILCGIEQVYYNVQNLNTAAGQANLAALLNAVPNGYYVALMSLDDINYNAFSPDLKQAFQNVGSTMITTANTSVLDGAPYTLVAKKADASFAVQEKTADPTSTIAVTEQTITSNVTVTGAKTPGTVTSTIIGPAYEWGTLFHDLKQVQQADEINLKVIARTITGTDSVYFDNVLTDQFNLASINANKYPYLKLKLTVNDTINISPAQLRRWLVTYTPAPEGIIRPDINGWASYTLGTFEAGQQVSIDFKFQNISDVTFRDSVAAIFTLYSNNVIQRIDTLMGSKIAPDAIETYTFTTGTSNLDEDNRVSIYVNKLLQPEQYYTNNFMEATFKVRKDNLHPILDVVFNGEHIMDGDIVAPDPTITISLKDENKFLYKDDTVGMKIMLIKGENGTPQQIDLSNTTEISFTPATANSDFRIVYTPQKLENGMYTLLVQGADKTGNQAAADFYKIRFQIVNESSITHFYPYPNPFTTSCKFVYTLTGKETPKQMKIQILTVTGKVVREITQDELGEIRIGVNGNRSTDFTWNGTDEYGDKLANGVYLYRVVIGDRGENFKEQTYNERESAVASKAFKKNYGKLYILR